MDQNWLGRNEGKLPRCPLPPGGCEGGYRGVERVRLEMREKEGERKGKKVRVIVLQSVLAKQPLFIFNWILKQS